MPESPGLVALVTGAAQGLGHAAALRLAADGYRVAVNDIADDGRLRDLADRIGGAAVPGDIADPGAGPRLARAFADRLGPVQMVPRFAGSSAFARIPEIDRVPDYDVAVLGVPFDNGTSYRPGARFGPMAVRQASRHLRPGHHVELDCSPFSDIQVVDAGDVPGHPVLDRRGDGADRRARGRPAARWQEDHRRRR